MDSATVPITFISSPIGSEVELDFSPSAMIRFAMSPRALQPLLSGKLKGVWNLFGMGSIDTVMKRTAPRFWYENKKKKIFRNAEKALSQV
jgi:hypothetical protein